MKNNALLYFAGVLVALSSFLVGKVDKPFIPFSSVPIANEYHSTTTDLQANFANYRVIREGTDWSANPTTTPGVLGSIVITKTGTAAFNVYDATSTKTNAEAPTTTIASFPASATVGTYTFDVQIRRGILIEFVDAAPLTRASTTITYRLNQ